MLHRFRRLMHAVNMKSCVGMIPERTVHQMDRSHPDFVHLRSESVRLSTFHNWPSSAGRIVEPRELAAAGLFYTGHADRVQCAFCRGCLRNWRQGDRPEEEHRRHFPDCPLIRGAATGNIPCDTSTTVVSLLLALSHLTMDLGPNNWVGQRSWFVSHLLTCRNVWPNAITLCVVPLIFVTSIILRCNIWSENVIERYV